MLADGVYGQTNFPFFVAHKQGVLVGHLFVVTSSTHSFTQRAVKPRPSGRGYKAHLNSNFCLFVCAAIDWNLWKYCKHTSFNSAPKPGRKASCGVLPDVAVLFGTRRLHWKRKPMKTKGSVWGGSCSVKPFGIGRSKTLLLFFLKPILKFCSKP